MTVIAPIFFFRFYMYIHTFSLRTALNVLFNSVLKQISLFFLHNFSQNQSSNHGLEAVSTTKNQKVKRQGSKKCQSILFTLLFNSKHKFTINTKIRHILAQMFKISKVFVFSMFYLKALDIAYVTQMVRKLFSSLASIHSYDLTCKSIREF